MRAKLVKESLLEFHKTGDPLRSLNIGIEAKLQKYEALEILPIFLLKQLDIFLGYEKIAEKLYVIGDTSAYNVADYLNWLCDTIFNDGTRKATMDTAEGTQIEMYDTPIGNIIHIETMSHGVFLSNKETTIKIAVWDKWKI